MLSGFVRTAHELYAVRFLLGFAEAGYFPGIPTPPILFARRNRTYHQQYGSHHGNSAPPASDSLGGFVDLHPDPNLICAAHA